MTPRMEVLATRPKFPMPVYHNFLLRYYARKQKNKKIKKKKKKKKKKEAKKARDMSLTHIAGDG